MVGPTPDNGTPRRQLVVVGIAWYRKDQWTKLLDFSADRDRLEASYSEWLEVAEARIGDLREEGVLAEKVEVDVDDLVRWCQAEGCPVDGDARSRYVAGMLRSAKDRT